MHNFALANMLHSVLSSLILTLFLILSLHFIEIICKTNHGLEVVPERMEFLYGNDKYARNIKCNVRRYCRKCPYVSHFEAELLQEFGDNTTFSVVLYEYLHNEYKLSFIELKFKLCDFIKKDDFLGSHIRKRGIPCPLSRGHWNISNLQMSFPVFPYVFPFKRAKAVITSSVTATGEVIATGNFYIFFKQN